MGWKKYDTSTLDSLDLMRIERMKKYINSLNLNKPFLYRDLPQAYNPVDPDHPELGNVQARAGIDQGKSNTYTVKHTDGTQSRVWSSGVHCAGGQHQSPRPREAPLQPPQPPSTLDRMLRVGKAIGVIR
jgi:hypothetical protein